MMKMLGLRPLMAGGVFTKRVMVRTSPQQARLDHHDHGPPMPFENMPFKIRNRFLTTVIFGFFFGSGLWAPYLIVWYSMAKRTL